MLPNSAFKRNVGNKYDFFTISHYGVPACIVPSTQINTLRIRSLHLQIDRRCMYAASIKLMANHCIMTPNSILENRLFFQFFNFFHDVVWDQLIHELYEGAVLVSHRNYEFNTIPAYKRFQLLLIVTEKMKGPKIMKMTVWVRR